MISTVGAKLLISGIFLLIPLFPLGRFSLRKREEHAYVFMLRFTLWEIAPGVVR